MATRSNPMEAPAVDPTRVPMSPQFLKSLITHTVVLSVLLLAGSHQTEAIRQKEEQVLNDMRLEKELAKEEAEEEIEELAEEMIEEEVLDNIEDLIAEELEEEDEADLLERLEEALDEKMDEATEDRKLTDMGQEELDELKEELTKATFDELRMSLDDLRKEAIMREVRRYIREEVAPKLKDEIEKELKRRAGEDIKNAMAHAAKREVKSSGGEAKRDLDAAIKALSKVKSDQDRLRKTAGRNPKAAAKTQGKLNADAERAQGQVKKALDKLAKSKPSMKAKAETQKKKADASKQAMAKARETLDKGDKRQASKAVADASKKLSDQARALGGLARELDGKDKSKGKSRGRNKGKSRSPQLDPAQKEVAREAIKPVSDRARIEVAKEVARVAVPQTAKHIAGKVRHSLQKLGVREDKFVNKVKKEIVDALKDELMSGRQRPDPKAAMAPSKEAFGGKNPETLAKAKAKVDHAIDKLKSAQRQQDQVKGEADKHAAKAEAPSKPSSNQKSKGDQSYGDEQKATAAQKATADKQGEVAADIKKATQNATKSLQDARTVASSKSDSQINAAMKELTKNTASKAADKAAQAMAEGKAAPAAQMMGESSKSLQKTIAGMDNVSKSLGKELSAAKANASKSQSAESDVKLGTGESKAAAVQSTAQAASTAASKSISQSVQSATQSTNKSTRSGMNRGQMGRMAKMSELAGKLNQIAKNMEEGRGLAETAGQSPLPSQGGAQQPLTSSGDAQGDLAQQGGKPAPQSQASGVASSQQVNGQQVPLGAATQQSSAGGEQASSSGEAVTAQLQGASSGGEQSSGMNSSTSQQAMQGQGAGQQVPDATGQSVQGSSTGAGAGVKDEGATAGAQQTGSGSGSSIGLEGAEGGAEVTNANGTGFGGQQSGGVGDGSATSNRPSRGVSNAGAYGINFNTQAGYNREVYSKFREFIKDRREEVESDGGIYAGDEMANTANAGATSTARSLVGRNRAALIFVESLTATRPRNWSNIPEEGQRLIPTPSFKSLAFGVAPLQRTPLRIDGDLSDWGTLNRPLVMQWGHQDSRPKNPISLYIRWNRAGLYFCYRVEGRTKIEPNLYKTYEGDCLEVFLDVENLRKAVMEDSPYSQQFSLMPFGFRKNLNGTFCEIGRGFRGIPKHGHRVEYRTDMSVVHGKSAAKMDATGYTVEGYISIKALAKAKLRAGQYIAFNCSINQGFDYARGQQWSMSKSQKSWNRPETWGDVLLLGADARAKFTDPRDASLPPKVTVPGHPMGIEVQDPDMNKSPGHREKVLAKVQIKGSPQLMMVILEETGANTGVFRGAFNTQAMLLPRKDNTMNLRGGEMLQLIYDDRITAHGEVGRVVQSEISVGLPVFRLAKR